MLANFLSGLQAFVKKLTLFFCLVELPAFHLTNQQLNPLNILSTK
jgi:hypothetical protein